MVVHTFYILCFWGGKLICCFFIQVKTKTEYKIFGREFSIYNSEKLTFCKSSDIKQNQYFKKKIGSSPFQILLHSNTSMNHLNELIDTRNHGIKMMNTFPSILVTHHSQFSLPGDSPNLLFQERGNSSSDRFGIPETWLSGFTSAMEK